MIYPSLDLELPASFGRVHFVGVGGSGMSGIARMLVERGFSVSGSDASDKPVLAQLRELGVRVFVGHAAENVAGADTVIITTALDERNPEYVAARSLGLPVLHRAHALAWLANPCRVTAVAGAHGKTTTTGMVAMGLRALGADPSFINGGVILPDGLSQASGAGPDFVIEADESDRSFLLYDSAVSVITNVDPEHLDFYGSREAFFDAFVEFACRASRALVVNADDENTVLVADRARGAGLRARLVTFGESADADVRVRDIDTRGKASFVLDCGGQSFPVRLGLYGKYNVLNAAAAVAALVALGFAAWDAVRAVSGFVGIALRFQFFGEALGVRVYDDYAHHHTEVAALLAGARAAVPEGGRLIAVHQPHLYSRTGMFYREFARAFEGGADYTVVLPVDGGREKPVSGVGGELVAESFTDRGRVRFFADWREAALHLCDVAREGDVFLNTSGGSAARYVPFLLGVMREVEALRGG